MATESFYEDLIIDTPEAAANLEALFDSGVFWTSTGTKFREITDEEILEMYARFKAREREAHES